MQLRPWIDRLEVNMSNEKGSVPISNRCPSVLNKNLVTIASSGLAGSAGFSLIELVVVIAILGVLLSLALPRFLSIKDDAKMNQAKNALASIVKECEVAYLRGRSTALKDIASAPASLSGYRLKVGRKVQGTSDYSNSECYQSVIWPAKSPAALATQFFASPETSISGKTYAATPEFMIVFKPSTGETFRVCTYADEPDVNKAGCTPIVTDPFTGNTVGEW